MHKKPKLIKFILGQLHLWLGLVAGIIIVISMLGAAVFVWEKELTDWYYADYVFVSEVGQKTVLPSELLEQLNTKHPGPVFRSIRISVEPNRAWRLSRFQSNPEKGFWWWDGIKLYENWYVDPYTGQTLGVVDMRTDWIKLSRHLHQNLLLNSKVGTQIIGVAALIMIFMALSGLYLWWPKNKRMLKQRLKIKWKARWKRVNWDLHSVGGFYTHILVLFFASTGLVWSYGWWSDGVYRLLGNDPEAVFQRPDPIAFKEGPQLQALDVAFDDARAKRPDWTKISLSMPKAEKAEGLISVSVTYPTYDSGWITRDQYTYHPENGSYHWGRRHEDKLLGEKWRNSNYDLHVGSIYGLPSKIIAFLSALFFASLPISGF
ncbi:MAG: PepSY-associated TM helix domain-containing protein, partial [Bacteroidota bacterium]